MHKNRKLFLYIGIFIVLPQCAPGAYNKRSKPIKKNNLKKRSAYENKYFKKYKAYIDGVECVLCAHNVIDLIKGVDGVIHVDYEPGTTGYDDGSLIVTWDSAKGEVPQEKIKNILQKEEFIMQGFEAIKEKFS